jgi:HSP20 family protein
MLSMLFRKAERPQGAALRVDLDRFCQDFFGDGIGCATPSASFADKGFAPAMDLKEREDAYVAEIEMPGMKAEDFHVEVLDGVLSIRGERKQETEEKTKQWHRSERVYGSFERRIELPSAVDAEKVEAVYKDGILTVTVPKAPGAKPRTIQVQVK